MFLLRKFALARPVRNSNISFRIFQQVRMQSLVQSTRLYVYNIVDAFLNSYRDHLKSMGEQFLSSYAILANGEKDPRNLLVAFKIAHVILTEFDISKHVEVSMRLVRDHRNHGHCIMRSRPILT